MAEYSAAASLVTPAGTIAFNGAGAPTYLHDKDACSGLDGAPARAPSGNKPVTHGGIWHRFFKGPREVTLGGLLRVDSIPDLQTLEAALLAACESIFDNPAVTGTYRWTPTGLTLHSITVRCDVLPTYSGPAYNKQYTFGLIAIDPTITIL
jgi:hypothetical protein